MRGLISIPVIIGSFVWVFVCILLFLIFNSMVVGTIQPTMLNVVNNSGGLVDPSTYTRQSNVAINSFYIMFAIMIIAPFLYFAVRMLFKREIETTGGYYQ